MRGGEPEDEASLVNQTVFRERACATHGLVHETRTRLGLPTISDMEQTRSYCRYVHTCACSLVPASMALAHRLWGYYVIPARTRTYARASFYAWAGAMHGTIYGHVYMYRYMYVCA